MANLLNAPTTDANTLKEIPFIQSEAVTEDMVMIELFKFYNKTLGVR